MISLVELRKVARARLSDARALCKTKRYDGAKYLAGYAVEIGLKARICKTLGWREFPETSKEFEGLITFKTWDPEDRYRAVGSSRREAELMIASAEAILSEL